ncbi:MAG: CPBP family glutamic-type intramembrane protease [Myxococcales bacterium]
MSDLLLAGFAWLTGFALLRRFGTVLPLFAMALLAAALALRHREARRVLRANGRAVAVGLAAAGVQIAATYLLYPLCVRAWPPLADEVRGLQALLFHGQGRLAVGALVATMSACEEILFRGRVLQDRPRRVVLAALLYAAAHATSGSPVLIALAFGCGLYWGALRAASGSLWTSIVCHVAWDLVVMVIAPL